MGLNKDEIAKDNEDPLTRAIRLSQEEANKRNSTSFQQQNFQPSNNPLNRKGSFISGSSAPPKLKYKEADVKKLMKMGFNHEQAVQALVENNHDVTLAAEALSHGH